MVANRKVTGTAKSFPVGIAIGTAVSLIITILGTLITAWFVVSEKISEEAIGYCAMAVLLAASMAGAFTSKTMVKHRILPACAATALCYFLALIAITALFFGGQYQGIWVTALVITSGAAVIILLGLRGNTHEIKKYRYG